MANKLKISFACLSTIENGKKKVPDDFKDKLCANYSLSKDEENHVGTCKIEDKSYVNRN